MDRPFEEKVNIFLGPATDKEINPQEKNIFMGICQQHHAEMGAFLPGCPPHAEVIVNGIFDLFPDIEKPKYADESEEKKLGEMLQKILSMT
jgi:Ni,Fe-hydrogenase III small subunit